MNMLNAQRIELLKRTGFAQKAFQLICGLNKQIFFIIIYIKNFFKYKYFET